MTDIKLSIIVPAYNNFNFTRNCIKDLSKLPEDHQIVLVDNGSTDQTYEYFSKPTNPDLPLYFTYLRFDEPLGFARASNAGYKASMGQFILFLNNDVRVNNNHSIWTQSLIEAAEDGSLVSPTGCLLNSEYHFLRNTDKIEEGNFYLSAWCLAGKKEIFDKLILPNHHGPFCEEFGLAFYEDSFAGLMAKRKGINLKIVSVPLSHFVHQTTNKLNTSLLYQQARLKFIEKWTKILEQN